ncbi:unnamed protein product, partial [Gadus morhua 'NCC']
GTMADYVYNTTNSTTPTYPLNHTGALNATHAPFSPFEGCELMAEGILFDLIVQCVNVVMGIPANILVITVLLRNRKEPSTSDLFLGCLAFLDIYYGAMVPINILNLYHWESYKVWLSVKFSYGVKDTSGPLFLSCICLDRFVAVLFPIAFGTLRAPRYRISLSTLVLGLTLAYASAKTVGGLPDFEKVFTGEILAVFVWMIVCNAAILLALKRSRGAGKDAMHPMKKKAFKMVLAILVLTVCNYLPPVALFPFEDAYAPDVFRCYVQPVGFAFLNISSSTQPLIFLSRLERSSFLPECCVKWCFPVPAKQEEGKSLATVSTGV